jgi:nitrate/nitrite transporter NarK
MIPESPPVPVWRQHLGLLCIILAGEAVFSLPFHIPRFFRPSVLEAFGISNTALGDAFAVYGLTAMLSYVPGGWLADRYPARRLIVVGLLATALGGLYLASFPGPSGLRWLYGWWGVTTILLFWAAMIRATREWGGAQRQGRAFGLLEGGRGALAALLASLAVAVLAAALGGAAPEHADRVAAVREVIFFYTALTAGIALLCALGLPRGHPVAGAGPQPASGLADRSTGRLWLQALVVVCAYCGYKALDYYTLYLVKGFGLDEVDAAGHMAAAAWLRPLAAVLAGLLADRFRPSLALCGLFALGAACALALGTVTPSAALRGLLLGEVLLSVAAVYALRGVYFALLEETAVPHARTGFAVGLVSVIGFTPDVFFAPIAGRLLDAEPGLPGLQHLFLLLAGIALAGLATSAWLARRTVRASEETA